MRKAVAQVASKARGNKINNKDDNTSTPPKAASSTPPPKAPRAPAVKSHTKMTPDEAALAAKNYRLAKELSELRVRHREESKTVTKLNMENMTLASKCREVMREAALYKTQLEQQRATMTDWQRQQTHSGGKNSRIVSPGLVSSDDFVEETSTSIESEVAPPSAVTPEKSPVIQAATVNPHRFFPQSASPVIHKTGYNEEFPGDIITPATPTRRVNFKRMGSFEELEFEDDVEGDTPPDVVRHRDAPGTKTKMSSLDAFEASFQTDIARSFSSGDNVPPTDEIYDPFANSPVKLSISAKSPTLDKPYEANSSSSPARGRASDPPGVDKTSTRMNGPLYKDAVPAKSNSSPHRVKKTDALKSLDLTSPEKTLKKTNEATTLSPQNQVQSTPVSKGSQPVQPLEGILSRESTPQQVITVQSTPVSPRESTLEASQASQVSYINSILESTPPASSCLQGASEESSTSSQTEKRTVPATIAISPTAPTKYLASIEKTPTLASNNALCVASKKESPKVAPTNEKLTTEKPSVLNGTLHKSPSVVNTHSPSTTAPTLIPYFNPSVSAEQEAHTSSPRLSQSPVSQEIQSMFPTDSKQIAIAESLDPETPTSIPEAAALNGTTIFSGQSSKPASPVHGIESVTASALRAAENNSPRRFSNQGQASENGHPVKSPQSPSWAKVRPLAHDGSERASQLTTSGVGSILAKTSPSFQEPKLILESDSPRMRETGNGASSPRDSPYRGSSSPFRKTFGDVRSTWTPNASTDEKGVSSSNLVTPSASARSWQKNPNDSFRPSWSHDRDSSRSGSKTAPIESRPWQTEGQKSSRAQQDRSSGVISSLVSRHAKAASRSTINRNGYLDQQRPAQSFKPSMKIKEIAAAFEARTPERSYATFSDASTPSDEEMGEIPMSTPMRVEEIRKSLNSQFGQ